MKVRKKKSEAVDRIWKNLEEPKLGALEKAQQRKREMAEQRKAQGLKAKYRNPHQVHLDNPKSMKAAIQAKCFDCVGRDCEVGYQVKIRTCTVTQCPLYNFRPYRKKSRKEPE